MTTATSAALTMLAILAPRATDEQKAQAQLYLERLVQEES